MTEKNNNYGESQSTKSEINTTHDNKLKDIYKDTDRNVSQTPENNSKENLIVETTNVDIQFCLVYNGEKFLIYINYKGKINSSFIKVDTDILEFNSKRNSKIAGLIKQVTEGHVQGEKAKDLVNELMSKLGNEKYDELQELVNEYNSAHKKSQSCKNRIDATQFCEEFELDENTANEILQTAYKLAKEGNSLNYITDSLKQISNLNPEDLSDIAFSFKNLINTEMKENKADSYFINSYDLIVPMLANQIMEYNNFLTVGKSGKKDIYVYRDGLYINDGITVIRKTVNELLNTMVKEKHRSEIIRYIEDETQIERNQLNGDKYLINFKNGVYDVSTGKFMEHSPNIWSTIRIPVEYDPKAVCPNINQFLSEVVSEKDAQTLIEFTGYSLIPDTRMQKALMVYGSGKNGKSVFLHILENIVGEQNSSGITLQKLDKDKFAVSRLFGRLVNISPDIPSKKITSDSNFKMLVGGDKIHGEEKYKESFEFNNTARLIFSANHLPPIASDIDENYAYYRRWLLVPFPKNFDGKKEDKNLTNKLTQSDELSGFLNLALEGLHRILKNNKFTHEKSGEEIEKIYEANINSIEPFFEDCISHNVMSTISKREMYEKYKQWCYRNDVISIKYNPFCKKIKLDCGLQDTRMNENGKKVGYWKMVTFKDDANG